MIPGLPPMASGNGRLLGPMKEIRILCACGCGTWFRRRVYRWHIVSGRGKYLNHEHARRARYETAAAENS